MLVVIGILIALGINNNNLQRIERKNELIYLRGLSAVLDQAGIYDTLDWPQSSPLQVSNMNLLQSRSFENNILMFLLASQAIHEAHYLPLMDDLDTIPDLLNKAIDTSQSER